MISSAFSKRINPVYILVGGAFGGAIPFFMYLWKFPTSTETVAQQFVNTRSFLTWIFLFSILFSVITIILIPGWTVFHKLYSSAIKENSQWNVLGMLVISATIYLGAMVALNSLSIRVVDLPNSNFWAELNIRFAVVYIYTILGVFLVVFNIILINYMAQIMSSKIDMIKDDKKETLMFIQEYLDYRNLLQACLIISGILLSLLPIITSAFYSIWKEIGVFTTETFPSQVIIVYGLIFTALLILIYAPTYFTLTNVGRELRDAKYPLDVDTLEATMKNRKMLDDLLQTNIGLTENLKNGIFTLSPLVSGLLAGLLGFK
jgi:hypothetical protein